MARRRRFNFMKRARRSSRAALSTYRRSSSSNKVGLMDVALAGGYGATRGYIANFVQPYTSWLPLGNLADNVAIGGLAWFANKKGWGGKMGRSATRSIVLVEAAMAGAELTQNTNASSNSSTGWAI